MWLLETRERFTLQILTLSPSQIFIDKLSISNIDFSTIKINQPSSSNDVGEPKSTIASERILDYNPEWDGKIQAFNCSVDNNHAKIFTDAFWEDLDLIISAVDGVAPRNFLMHQAKKYKKVFINAGTDGVRCSTGVYLPERSEAYKGIEVQGESAPSCTLKDHPYKIEHIMQYACDTFRELFVDALRGIVNTIQSIELNTLDLDFDKVNFFW